MYMCGHFSTLNLFIQLLLILVVAKSEVSYHKEGYYITPSQNVPCPQDPCLTLSQFTASFFENDSEMNLSLFFLPGNHSLDREMFLWQLNSVLMTKAEQMNYGNDVCIECSSQSGRFIIAETTFASITSLCFIGCGHNIVFQVEQFTV